MLVLKKLMQVDLAMLLFIGGPEDGYSVGYYNVQLTKG
jgi:hypothetical protein